MLCSEPHPSSLASTRTLMLVCFRVHVSFPISRNHEKTDFDGITLRHQLVFFCPNHEQKLKLEVFKVAKGYSHSGQSNPSVRLIVKELDQVIPG